MTLLDYPQVPLMLTQLQIGTTEVLSITGYLDMFTAPTLQPALLAAVERLDHPKAGSLTLDLSCVRFIDSAGLELLLGIRQSITEQERTLVIRLRPGSQPEALLQASKLGTLLHTA